MALPTRNIPSSQPQPRPTGGATSASQATPPGTENPSLPLEQDAVVETLLLSLIPEETERVLSNLEDLAPEEWVSLVNSITDEYVVARARVGSLFYQKAQEGFAIQPFILAYEKANAIISKREWIEEERRICLEDAITVTTIQHVLPEEVYLYFTRPLEQAGLFHEPDEKLY